MRFLTRNTLVALLIYALLVGGFAFWQRAEIAAARRSARAIGAHATEVYDSSLRRHGAVALGALALASGLGLAAYLIQLRRGRQVSGLLQSALAGQRLPPAQVKNEFGAALAAAGRVGQELNLERERTALDALETDLLLASQLRALSRVYRAVTHDLKAPLNAMVLNLDRLQTALRKGEGAAEAGKTQGYLDVLREELERLDRSLLALLADTTPAGSGREEFDVRSTLREIERLLLPQARLQHVALEAHLPGTAVRIAGQRDRLKQAILNIAINALEEMSDGGALEMILESLPEEAEVRIRDTGPGIPEAAKRRIFDIHYTTKTTGTGIGLYLARSIVEAHGGEISVENRPGRGTEFRMRLPSLGLGA